MDVPDDDGGGYRWSCPFCEKSRLKEGDSERTNAVSALRAHVLASVGDGHGPRNEFPPGFDPQTLSDYVNEVGSGE